VSNCFLLDANVLVAAAWPTHQAHTKVQRWLSRHAAEGWATCPLTESAFVRILSNPAFSPDALTPADALALLRTNLSHPSHRFWEADLSIERAVAPFTGHLVGHRQVTDAYLLGLVLHKKGILVTLDRSISSLLREKSLGRGYIIVIT